jgi:hypothetical protein
VYQIRLKRFEGAPNRGPMTEETQIKCEVVLQTEQRPAVRKFKGLEVSAGPVSGSGPRVDRQEGIKVGAGVMRKLPAGKRDAVHFVKTVGEERNPRNPPANHE